MLAGEGGGSMEQSEGWQPAAWAGEKRGKVACFEREKERAKEQERGWDRTGAAGDQPPYEGTPGTSSPPSLPAQHWHQHL